MAMPPTTSRGRRGTSDRKPTPVHALALPPPVCIHPTGDILRRHGGQRGVSGCTDGRWWWSNGTGTSCTRRRTRYGSGDSFGKDGTITSCTESHVPFPDAWAWVPGEISLHLCYGRVSLSARTKPLTTALSLVAKKNHRYCCGSLLYGAGGLAENGEFV